MRGRVVTETEVACGGVVIDDDGRVLLREPANHFGGAAWTFPKGRPNEGEDPAKTALRETLEETGVSAEIVGGKPIPGSFPGTVTHTVYFLMWPTGERRPPDKETWGVRWATRRGGSRADSRIAE